MLLSVIVPVYNAEAYLRRCLDSLLRQGVAEEYEIVCVDDGSTDGTLAILVSYKQEHPDLFNIVCLEHAGVAHARNKGIEIAKGQIVTFCDSDDYLIDGAYNRLLQQYWDDKTEVLTFGSVTVDRYAKKRLSEFDSLEGSIVYEGSGLNYYKNVNYHFSSCNHLFRREFLTRHQLCFKNRIVGEDVQFCLDVYLKDPQVKDVSCCLYRYMVNDSQTMVKRSPDLMKRMVKDYLLLLSSFHDAGFDRYISIEMVPMTSRLLSAKVSKKEYQEIKSKLVSIAALPIIGNGLYGKAINTLFRSFTIYQVLGIFYRKAFVPYVLPRMHRNANI